MEKYSTKDLVVTMRNFLLDYGEEQAFDLMQDLAEHDCTWNRVIKACDKVDASGELMNLVEFYFSIIYTEKLKKAFPAHNWGDKNRFSMPWKYDKSGCVMSYNDFIPQYGNKISKAIA